MALGIYTAQELGRSRSRGVDPISSYLKLLGLFSQKA